MSDQALPSESAGSATVRRLAAAAFAGAVLYVALDVVIGLLPPHYSILANAESDYGVGPYAYLMDINFVLRGLLSLALVGALLRTAQREMKAWPALAALALWAVCSALLALFPTSLSGQPISHSGRIHLLLAGIAFVCAAIAVTWVSSRLSRDAMRAHLARGWGFLCAWAWVALILTLAAGRGTHGGFAHLYGLWERLFLLSILSWIALLAWRLWHGARRATGA